MGADKNGWTAAYQSFGEMWGEMPPSKIDFCKLKRGSAEILELTRC